MQSLGDLARTSAHDLQKVVGVVDIFAVAPRLDK